MAGARAAVPPAKLSYHTQFVHGVDRGERGYAASVRLRKPGDDAAVYIEFLGARHKREWFAAVCHDLALCKRAFDAGGARALQALRHGPGAAPQGDADRLNFPLSCYSSQEAFWDALENSGFGQLVKQMLSSNALEKTLFYGDTWKDGLDQQRGRNLAQQQQQAGAAGPVAAEAATGSARAGRARDAEARRAVAEAAAAAANTGEERRDDGRQERVQPVARADWQAQGVVGKPSAEGAQLPRSAAAADSSSSPPLVEPRRDGQPAAPTVAAAAGTHSEAAAQQPSKPPPRVPSPSSSDEVPPRVQQAGKPAASAASSSSSEGDPVSAARAGKGPVVNLSSSSSEDVPIRVRAAGKPPALVHFVSSSSDSELAPARQAGTAGGASSGQGQPPSAQQQPSAEQHERPATEPINVWLKGSAEFPPGSGKYAMYLKAGPLQKNYYTVNKQASEALLPAGYEGEVVLKDAANGRTWSVHTNLKGGTQRYFTRVVHFNRDNAAKAHDVLWLQAEDSGGQPRPPVVLFGIWRFRSQEAAAFTEKLTGRKAPANATATASTARQPSPSPAPQQQEQQQVADSSAITQNRKRSREPTDSEEDVPLSARKAARTAAVARAARELLRQSEES